MNTLSLALLALALSLDSLTVGLLYGVRGIKLPWTAMAVVSGASGLLLAGAMSGGRMLSELLPAGVAGRLGALLLVGVGLWISYQTWRSHKRPGAQPPEPTPAPAPGGPLKVWRLRLGSIGIVIEILREPGAADLDHSGHISLSEACFLGVALALDSVAAGLGAAMAGFSPVGLPLAAAGGSLGLMLLGSRAARLLPFKLEGPWAMLHGVVLVALGLYRMVS
ncbi:MAG TPA: sporulation membrane protein YtaF [Symbiobacteriaceae bacterium]|jgi:putative sporulation protein YtaF|nr:sporulation membrane protein YtaF [Symbiobacteriaceae bacterium]